MNSGVVDELPNGRILDTEATPIFCDPDAGVAGDETIALDLFEKTLSLFPLGSLSGEA